MKLTRGKLTTAAIPEAVLGRSMKREGKFTEQLKLNLVHNSDPYLRSGRWRRRWKLCGGPF